MVTAQGERPAAVAVAGGRVAAVAAHDASLTAHDEVVLADDEVLLPGLVDSHVHVNEPGRTEWEGFDTATRSAAAGGVTTILDMPLNSIPPTVDTDALAVKRRAASGKCSVDVGFWGGAVPGNVEDLKPLYDDGVFGFKCFLADSGVEEFPPLTPAEFDEHARAVAGIGAPLIVHAEDADVLDRAPRAASRRYADFLTSRPRSAENAAVQRVLDAAARHGARMHVLHLSSADVLPALAAARSAGVHVTVETCPHYLFFDAESIEDGATHFKCCPPIREADNRELLWRGLEDGTIDCVVSDHSPCVAELKRMDLGDFDAAWGGVSGLQLRLPVVWSAARRRGRTLSDVVRWCAQRPADVSGLTRKGRLEVGYDADFCVLAPEETFVVNPAALQHRNAVTPYAGCTLTGVVRSTWLRGGRISAQRPSGRLLSRGKA